MQITNVANNDDDVFPPSAVTNLKSTLNLAEEQIEITFTAPGDDFNDGTGTYVSEYARTHAQAHTLTATCYMHADPS